MRHVVLVAYATRQGSTREVAEAVTKTLRAHGVEVEIRPAGEVENLDPYDAVVLGGALYTGHLHRDARAFLRRHRDELATLPLAVFGMGPKTLAEGDVAGSRAQLDRELAKVPELEPVSVAIFGGVVDPSKLHFPFSHLPQTDARDWNAIKAWSIELVNQLGEALPVAVRRDAASGLIVPVAAIMLLVKGTYRAGSSTYRRPEPLGASRRRPSGRRDARIASRPRSARPDPMRLSHTVGRTPRAGSQRRAARPEHPATPISDSPDAQTAHRCDATSLTKGRS